MHMHMPVYHDVNFRVTRCALSWMSTGMQWEGLGAHAPPMK